VTVMWKYGTGSISACRWSSQSWVCAVWHLGQLRLPHVMGNAHYVRLGYPFNRSLGFASKGSQEKVASSLANVRVFLAAWKKRCSNPLPLRLDGHPSHPL
jgi:hypothetical protein